LPAANLRGWRFYPWDRAIPYRKYCTKQPARRASGRARQREDPRTTEWADRNVDRKRPGIEYVSFRLSSSASEGSLTAVSSRGTHATQPPSGCPVAASGAQQRPGRRPSPNYLIRYALAAFVLSPWCSTWSLAASVAWCAAC